ncbi:MAG TPA: hypothetical protein VJG31_01335 [Candidatus Nanoarchaeia archaeon]|nr:hypothetical protein [Candidatus Nanoarchaeia archaeon]
MDILKAIKIATKVQAVNKTSLQKEKRPETILKSEHIRQHLRHIKEHLAISPEAPPISSLKREVAALEERLTDIFVLEKELIQTKKKEEKRIQRLAEEVGQLKKKVYLDDIKDARKKIASLSHAVDNIKAAEAVAEEISSPPEAAPEEPLTLSPGEMEERLFHLENKLTEIKAASMAGQEDLINLLEERIETLRMKLESQNDRRPEIKHTMMMAPPLPPPSEDIPPPPPN